MKTIYSEEFQPFHFRTQEEVLTLLREFDPVIADSVIFLRPHHLHQWMYLHHHGYDHQKNVFDLRTLTRWLQKDLLLAAERDKLDLLSGNLPPYYIGIELEFLHILRDTQQDELSERDRKLLVNTKLTASDFDELAKKNVQMYSEILAKPGTTPVVMARTLDSQCQLLSPKGCLHCSIPVSMGNNTDDYFLRAVECLRTDTILEQYSRDQIRTTIDTKSGVIQSARFPLALLKDYRFVTFASAFASQIEKESIIR